MGQFTAAEMEAAIPPIRTVLWPLAALSRLLWRLKSFVLTVALILSLGLSGALILFDGAFALASGAVAAATGASTVHGRMTRKSAALKTRNASLARAAANPKVRYRGRMVPVARAVGDTSRRASVRVMNAARRNILTMPGEALPVFGIAVVAAATAWELRDTCALMKELHELDLAFNPQAAIDGTEVCGLKVPTTDELTAGVLTRASAIKERMGEILD